MLSFNNDVALKQQIIDNLTTVQIEDTFWNRNALAWDGTAGSFVGHILKSEDLSAWENLGLPKWLALTLDYFLITTSDLKIAVAANIAVLKAIPVGKDIQDVGSRFLIELIRHEDLGIAKMTQNDELLSALNAIVDIQKQCLNQENIAASTWRTLRKEMVENSQKFHDESLEYLISTFAEAAAWNPVSSRTAVSDSVRVWGQVKLKAEPPSPDWTQERETRVRALLQQLYDEAKAKQSEGSEEFIDVFKLLEEYEPEESMWLKAQMKWQRAQPAVFTAKAIKRLTQLCAQV